MRKRILSLLLCIVLCLSFAPTAVFAEDLPEMTGVTISQNGIMSWDAVAGAAKYQVIVGTGGGKVTGTSDNLSDRCARFGYDTGDYQVSLYALDSGENNIAAWTDTFHYVSTQPALAAPTNLRFEGSTCKWDPVPNATSYMVTLYTGNQRVGEGQYVTDTQYTFTLEAGKTYKFVVEAYASGYVHSEATSDPYTFNDESAAYTVSFDANGGSVTPDSAETGTNGKLASLPTPTRSGYSFDGWYTMKEGGTKVDTNTVFTAAATIYAHWSRSFSFTRNRCYEYYSA